MAIKNVRLAVMGLAVVGAVACGGDEGKDGVSINAATARQALTANTTDVAAKVSAAIVFLEQSDLMNNAFEAVAPVEDCVSVDGSGADFDSGTCSSEPVTLDTDLAEPTAELTNYLETRIFADGNIESSSGTSVTYRLKGSVVCADDTGVADPDCVDQVDRSEIRLKVTSPADGDVDVDLLVGPAKHNPLSFEVHQSLVAAEIDLGGLKGAVEFLAGDAEDVELPTTMQGRVRGEIEILGDKKARVALSVLTDIKVAGGDYAVNLGASSPAAELIADGNAQTLSTAVNLGALQVMGPYSTEVYSDLDGSFTEISHTLDVMIAGLSGAATLQGGSDTITLTNLGLGDTTSSVKVDGTQVLGIDLNADAGRAFAATIEAIEGGGRLILDPKFDLKVAIDMTPMTESAEDYADWMFGDVLHVLFDGTTPTIEFGDEGGKVVSGTLSMSLQNAGDSATLAAGECFGGTSTQAEPVPSNPDQPVEPVPTEPETTGGAFDFMAIVECPM